MGTACAPSYTNIFMARFEEKHIYPLTKDRVERYLRYTDDIFFIWKEMEKEMETFFNKINKKHSSIKFNPKYSMSDFEFIDVLGGYKQLYIRRKKTGNLIFMEHLTN